jgi:uncharacterized DUF497 family protein
MDFDWLDTPFELKTVTPREIEESFEDPFCLRLLPDSTPSAGNRYFNLGRAVNNRPLLTIFWTDGKKYRVIFSREMTPEEVGFYERKNSEHL